MSRVQNQGDPANVPAPADLVVDGLSESDVAEQEVLATGAPKERPTDRIRIHHPKTNGTTMTSRRAFAEVWEAKGWKQGPLPGS